MVTVELHCHTCYSPDSLMRPERILATMDRLGIDVVAITDHGTIEGARVMQSLAPERVIIGEEIMTRQGELLAFFVKEEIPKSLVAMDAIHELRRQGAFISVSHPFDHVRKGSWERADLMEITPHVDALEVFNARVWTSRANTEAAAWANEHDLIPTVGSDAHAWFELGRATHTMPEFIDRDEFAAAIKQSTTRTRQSAHSVHLSSRWAVWRKALGWRP